MGEFPSLREARRIRDKHADSHAFWRSVKDHRQIPSTFDGDNPFLAFETGPPRLRIGERYAIPDATGAQLEGVLESASVNVPEKTAYGVYKTDDGQRIIGTVQITDRGQAASRAGPPSLETFGPGRSSGYWSLSVSLHRWLRRI
jgi:hypothetical protein